MDSNTYSNDTSTNTRNTHNPLTGDGVTNTHNPLTGDKTGPHPPPGTNPVTGNTRDSNFGQNEQQAPNAQRTDVAGTGPGVTSDADAHNVHNPQTGGNTTITYNPAMDNKAGPNPPGADATTGRTTEGNFGRHEQQPVGHPDATGARTGALTTGGDTGAHTVGGTGPTSSSNTHNTHNPLTGDGVTNTHNPVTGDKTGPHPPADANPVTGRTAGGDLGRHEQRPVDQTGATSAHTTGAHTTGAHTGAHTMGGVGVTSGRDDHNTHNPLTGDGVTNTHNPMTGDKTGPHPPADTNPVTGRTAEGNLGRHEQQPVGHTDTTGALTGAHTTGAHTGTHTGAGAGIAPGRDDHNTHNPLTGDGVTNTHNPMTGDKTGPHPPADTNPVTGRTAGGDLGRHEQQPVGHTGTTGAHTGGTHTTGAHTGTHTGAGAGVVPGRDDRNTHNPLTGDGVANTHNPLTGDKTGPHPPAGTNPATGRTNDGNLGRNEQQPGTTGTTGIGPHTIHDTTRGAHTTGAGGTTATGTSQQPTSTKASGGGAKAALGRVEATVGAMINNTEMHIKGVQRQDEAKAAKLAKEQGAHGGADVRH